MLRSFSEKGESGKESLFLPKYLTSEGQSVYMSLFKDILSQQGYMPKVLYLRLGSPSLFFMQMKQDR
jgi:hypothetical protein